MTVEDASGLYPTPVRVKLLTAVRDEPGRIYFEAGACYDATSGRKRTAEVRDVVRAEWIRARRDDEPRNVSEWSATRTYYRITPAGRAAIERGKR